MHRPLLIIDIVTSGYQHVFGSIQLRFCCISPGLSRISSRFLVRVDPVDSGHIATTILTTEPTENTRHHQCQQLGDVKSRISRQHFVAGHPSHTLPHAQASGTIGINLPWIIRLGWVCMQCEIFNCSWSCSMSYPDLVLHVFHTIGQ